MSRIVKERFSKLAKGYDFFNHFFSMGIDVEWRDDAAKEAMLGKKAFSVLDSTTGTGDLAFAVYRQAVKRGKKVRIFGTDFTPQMLEIAKEKAKQMGIKAISFRLGDSLKTGYKNNSFDVITTAFSLRNFDDVGAFILESRRILKSNGRLVLLEMALPDKPMQRFKFRTYSYFLRFMSLFTDPAYNWLVDSINKFDKHALAEKVRASGFRHVRMRELDAGVAFLLTAEK